jgi:hypothetical protein
VTIKVWDEQGVEEYKRRLEKVTFEEDDVGKYGDRAEGSDRESDDEKGGDSKGAKRAGSKNGWWVRGCEHLKKEAVKALRA